MQYAPKKLAYLCAALGIGMSWLGTGLAAEPEQPSSAIAESTMLSTHAPIEEESSGQSLSSEWQAVSQDYLDDMRGGFDTGAGLTISFGIERAVYINGDLATATSFNIPDVGKITNEQAQMIGAAVGTVNLVQNGPGNTFQPDPVSHSTAATVIQNTLNNQDIRSLTVINTTANSLEMLKGLNLQSALRDIQINSATGN